MFLCYSDHVICSLFIFDHTVLKREEDDLKDAILYFYPHTVSNDNQCALVGKIIGISDFLLETLPKSPPTIIKLQNEKFAMKRTDCYSIGLGSSLSVADTFLSAHLEFVWKTFTFFQGGLSAIKQRFQKQQFLQELEKMWDSYLPFYQFYGDVLSQAFQLLPSVSLAKSDANVFLHASHILQRGHKQDGVLAGVLVYRNKVLCTQLSPDLTKRMLMLKPHQTHFPCLPLKVDFDKPDSVRLLRVFLSENEYKCISLRRTDHLRRNCRKNKNKLDSDYSQFDNEVFIQDGVNLTTLHTVHCKTAVPETLTPTLQIENPPSYPEHQNMSFIQSESLCNEERSEMKSATDTPKTEQLEIANSSLPFVSPLKGDSSEHGEPFRTVNGLSRSLTERPYFEQCQMPQVSENKTLSHGENENRISTSDGCLSPSNEILSSQSANLASVTSPSNDQNESHVVTTQSDQDVLTSPRFSSSQLNDVSEDIGEDLVSSSTGVNTQKEMNVGSEVVLEEQNCEEPESPISSEHEQTKLLHKHESTIDGSKLEINCKESLTESETLKDICDSQNSFCVEHKTSGCNCGTAAGSTDVKNLPGELLDTSHVAGLIDGGSNIAPTLSLVDHSHRSPCRSGSISSHSPSSKDNSYDDKHLAVSGGSLTSASEEKISSHKEVLHFPQSPECRTPSVGPEEMSGKKTERPSAPRLSETSSDIPQSSDSLTNSLQCDTNGAEWIPAADGLVDLVLYIQGHSETMLLLLLDHGCRCDSTLVHKLWKFSLPNLAELDFQVKDCLDELIEDQAQPHVDNYSYLRYDSFSKSLTGNVLDSVIRSSHEFTDTAIKIHQNFQELDTLTDVTFCSHKASVCAHRSVNHETFFQLNNSPWLSGGYPTPKDLTFTLDELARKKLQTDHFISLL
ncbi:uncharacterized protein LOC121368781 [Gigantopelta aegis]|uniref:uncharacterized protein LOC121368781 n=1 Tax=Gigantopelta aegis TaxID=1735272 RepID=UPI001B88E393|nr:uncharacterized protein LOC121368781 [Gigantopelta aegis]